MTGAPIPDEDQPEEVASTARLAGSCAPCIPASALPVIEVEGPGHTVRSVNAAFCALLGRPAADLVGKPFASLVGQDRRCIEVLDRAHGAAAAGTPGALDVANVAPVSWFLADWRGVDTQAPPAPVLIHALGPNDQPEVTTALNEALLLSGLRQHELREAAEKTNLDLQAEISERQRAERELLAAQAQLRANAAELELIVAERTAQLRASIGELEAFAYSLAHDLRAPVRAIHGFTQAVLEMPASEVGPPAVELLKRVVTAAIRMDSLIRDVLALNEVIRRPIFLVRVEVDTLIRSLMEERPELAAHRAEIRVIHPFPGVIAHEAMLVQCLSALLLNAVKFVTPGETPRVRIWAEEKPDHESELNGSRVRIWVGDEGIGIPPKAQERIFEMFERLHSTSQYEGAGIGLAIVRKATARMGGTVGVESDGKKGSRFWLELARA